MAIRIIEGVPGSGKSYYAVKHLADKYFQKQSDGRYELVRPCTIITNIDDFQPDHIQLKPLVKEVGGIKVFFEEYFQKALTDCLGGQIVYIIDEAQKWFRKGARDLDSVFSYFEYHRHFGHDIYLITQNSKKLPYDIACLTEYTIVAAPRTRSVIGEFKYKWISDGDIIKREGLKPDNGVFALYKSMDLKESEKIKNPVMRTVGLVVAFSLVVGLCFAFYLKHKFFGGLSKPVSAPSSSAASTSSAPPGSSQKSPKAPASDQKPEPVSVPVSVVTEWRSDMLADRKLEFVVFMDVVYPKSVFPHRVRRLMGQWFADVPPDVAKQYQEYSARAAGAPEHASDNGAAAQGGPALVSTSTSEPADHEPRRRAIP